MGLIKAAIGALGGTLADSWKESIHCQQMSNDVILRAGTKMNANSGRTSNYKGTDNVISNGSTIMVEENTCMLTIDNGKITNVVTEPGSYTLDNSSAPSIFAGQIKDSAKDFIRRFTFGGTPSVEQRVVYINLQPLPGIKFGTGTPMPYPDPRYNTTVDLRFYGTFEIKILDAEMAVRFYQEVANKGVNSSDMMVGDIFKSDQYRNEFMMSMMEALNMLSTQGVSYNQISSQLTALTKNVQAATIDNWTTRGFTVTNVAMGPVTISEETKELLKDRLKADTMLGGDVQRAVMTGAVARGIEAAGSNENGSMMGFMGMGMAQSAGANILGQMPQTQAPDPNAWKCSCGATSTGSFCTVCGNRKPEPWTCSCGAKNVGKFCQTCGKSKDSSAPVAPAAAPAATWKCICGTENTGKFCNECGAQKPRKYKCDKCGWVPEDPTKPPKFCPECGDPFNDEDVEK